MKISSVEEIRTMDGCAITEFGVPQELLMENAGQAAYYTILKEFGVENRKFVVFCGVGNNGGDGLVVARKLFSNGANVTAFIIGDHLKFTGAAKLNYDIAQKMQLPTYNLQSISLARKNVKNVDAIVDAIFGTGIYRNVTGMHKDLINMINAANKTVFSIDIPSGVHGDSGQVMGTAVKANYTITFGLPKTGNIFYPGCTLCGKLYISHISFPPVLYNSNTLKIAVNEPQLLPEKKTYRNNNNNKKVLFIAGSSNYRGGPYFAALSFLKAGGGLSYIAAPNNISPFIGKEENEIVFVPTKGTGSGKMGIENKQLLLQYSEKVDMVVIGPGLSLKEVDSALVRELSREINKPLLIDGDGIVAIADDLDCIAKRNSPTVLSLHAGEMAILAQQKTADILKNKTGILQNTSQKLNAIIILKGAHSLIGYPDKRVFINLSGNPEMATAGSDDALTGIVAAMPGLGFSINDSVRMGVFMHGFASDLAAKGKGKDRLVARDILEQILAAMKILHENFHAMADDYYQSMYVI